MKIIKKEGVLQNFSAFVLFPLHAFFIYIETDFFS